MRGGVGWGGLGVGKPRVLSYFFNSCCVCYIRFIPHLLTLNKENRRNRCQWGGSGVENAGIM